MCELLGSMKGPGWLPDGGIIPKVKKRTNVLLLKIVYSRSDGILASSKVKSIIRLVGPV